MYLFHNALPLDSTRKHCTTHRTIITFRIFPPIAGGNFPHPIQIIVSQDHNITSKHTSSLTISFNAPSPTRSILNSHTKNTYIYLCVRFHICIHHTTYIHNVPICIRCTNPSSICWFTIVDDCHQLFIDIYKRSNHLLIEGIAAELRMEYFPLDPPCISRMSLSYMRVYDAERCVLFAYNKISLECRVAEEQNIIQIAYFSAGHLILFHCFCKTYIQN